MHFLRFTFLVTLLSCASTVFGQGNCYNSSLNNSGYSPNSDSLEYFTCQIDDGLPEAVTSNFKVYSVVEYTLHKYKDPAAITRYKENTIDSLRLINPYNLIIWWSPVEEDDLFGRCDLAFTYPSDTDFQNCFTSVRTTIIASQLQEFIDSELERRGYLGNDFWDLEKQVISLLKQKVAAVQDCCDSSPAKSEDECTSCPVGEELLTLKRRAYLNEVGTSIPASEGGIEVALVDGNQLNKSNTGFLNLVGSDLIFGDLHINLQDKYNEFLSLGDTICAFPAYFTTDETLCFLEIDNWERGDRTIINLASSEEGIILEMSEYTDENCYLFGDYLIDELDEVFGVRYIDFPVEEDMLNQGRGAVENPEEPASPQTVEGLLAPSGVVIAETDPNNVSLKMDTWWLIATDGSYIPKNTLSRFVFNQITYKCYKTTLDVDPGYYDANDMADFVDKKKKLNKNSLSTVKRFDRVVQWAVRPEGESAIVSGFKDHGCNGVEQCSWTITTPDRTLDSDHQEVVIPPNGTNCFFVDNGDNSNSDICCSAGRAFVDGNITATTSDEDKRVIKKIGKEICLMGETLFNEYQNDTWGELPDLLKALYELKYDEYTAAQGSYEEFEIALRARLLNLL